MLPQRVAKASHTVAALVVAVVAFLGAMQVIGTQAQGDDDILREISEKARAAQTSSGVTDVSLASPFTSSLADSEAEPLPSRSGFVPDFVPGTDATTQPEEKLGAQTPLDSPGDAQPSPEAATAPPEDDIETATTSACTPGAGPYCVYLVQEGDTLSAIAETLGLQGTPAFSAAELIALSNGLNDAQNWLITVGQELRVPVDSGVIHTVGADESVSVLASLYGVSAADIVAANGLSDANTVVVGSTLLVPSPNLWPVSGPAAAVAEDETPDEAVTEEPEPEADAAETPEGEAEATEDEAETADTVEDDPPADNSQDEADTPEPTPTTEPARTLTASSSGGNPSVTEIKDLFAAGYIAAGGPPQYLEKMLASVIACESGYNLRAFNPAGPFYGLMQFLPATWANTGGGDWFDPWQQGHNTGVLLQTSTPQSQWPSCWR